MLKLLIITKRPMGSFFKEMEKEIKLLGFDYYVEQKYNEKLKADLVIVVGEDRDILESIQEMGNKTKPLLGVSITGKDGFLTETSLLDYKIFLRKILKNEYSIEKLTRIRIKCGKNHAYALNEAAIFPSKSASLMEYALYVDEEFLWRDYSDGVIISTPYGSTAYAMSAGGPIISPKSKVLSIVSVNSIDPSRRPLIVPDNSLISIRDVNSRYIPEIVVDGIRRLRVTSDIQITKSRKPVEFIRILSKSAQPLQEKIKKKMAFAQELQNLPPSAKLVLKILEYEGALSQKELIKKTMLPPRTVRHALKLLINKGFVRERPALLRDARQKIYQIK